MDATRPQFRLRRRLSRTGSECPNLTRREKRKTPNGDFRFSGGEGGIRTHEGQLTLAGFQDQCIQPLCHLSKLCFLS